MGSRLSHIAVHPPIYHPESPSSIARRVPSFAQLIDRLADFLRPQRVCKRTGYHIPGHDVFSYESWDLDHRYPGPYAGHACGRCGEVV